jgi:hypothetical protein
MMMTIALACQANKQPRDRRVEDPFATDLKPPTTIAGENFLWEVGCEPVFAKAETKRRITENDCGYGRVHERVRPQIYFSAMRKSSRTG